MEARILEKSEETKWDKFVYKHPLGNIHQTSKWGQFQEKIAARGKYWIIVLEDKGKLIGGSMIIRHIMPKSFCWLYCARGPLLDYHSKNIQKQMNEIIKALSPIAKKEKAIFMRIDPALEKTKAEVSAGDSALQALGFKKSHHGFQPEHTLILNITKSEEEILAQMKPKGRYNIGLAKKKGVTVRKSDPKAKKQFKKDMEIFYKILNETTTRDKFHGHGKGFYEQMLKTLSADKKANTPEKAESKAEVSNEASTLLYLAEFEGKTIAGIIVTFYKDKAIYYYGASSNAFRSVMAPYLLQWTAILEAKEKGLQYYDFLGVSPTGAKNHPWAGVTEFKKKFGGDLVAYSPAQEFPFKKLHHFVYRMAKLLRSF